MQLVVGKRIGLDRGQRLKSFCAGVAPDSAHCVLVESARCNLCMILEALHRRLDEGSCPNFV